MERPNKLEGDKLGADCWGHEAVQFGFRRQLFGGGYLWRLAADAVLHLVPLALC